MAIYIIIAVILVVVTGFFFAFPSPKKTLQKPTFTTTNQGGEPEKIENRYYDLRKMALKITPDLVGGQSTGRATKVFGIVMDWDTGEGTVTVVAFQNGDASMYVSSGGGIIGGAQYRKVRKAVRSFVELGQDYIGKAEKTTTTLLPDRHNVGFYLLTNKGTFHAQEEWKAIEYGNSDWRPLFNEANKVLERLRQISEKKS
ncbi:hypothetical protein [Prolixibacter denitrificans]|uniref:Uncharacterized protein n=1 Tax=Prolixibacter denitrificans TaxID=1541063 RepID=A0A2P8C5X0_9BACT|nr:hypothetical protein [Prolixibacter denitrificans]PSK80360.1 hypothetical protein CLV93_1174 [Prolixibacter denitrificans]GET23069.1 hypothetical protein JCM18694_33150 [Prolixibacter denitrificans]